MNRRAYLFLALLAAIWGASYLFIKIALRDLSPVAVVGIRAALGALVLLALPITRRTLRQLRGRYHLVAALALAQVVLPFMLITLGEQDVASSLAGILIATQPVFVAVLAPLFVPGTRIAARVWLGLALGLAGVMALLGIDLSGDRAALVAAALILGAALCYSVAIFLLRRWMPDVSPVGASGAMLIASTLVLLPPTLLSLPASWPSATAIISLLLLGVVGTGLAFLLFFILLADIGAGRAALVSYLTPPFSVMYGALFLDERITPAAILGLALILIGAWLATRTPGSHPAGAAYVTTGKHPGCSTGTCRC